MVSELSPMVKPDQKIRPWQEKARASKILRLRGLDPETPDSKSDALSKLIYNRQQFKYTGWFYPQQCWTWRRSLRQKNRDG